MHLLKTSYRIIVSTVTTSINQTGQRQSVSQAFTNVVEFVKIEPSRVPDSLSGIVLEGLRESIEEAVKIVY